mgnify:CR=1 FL=1
MMLPLFTSGSAAQTVPLIPVLSGAVKIGDEADARGRFGVARRPEVIVRQLDGEVGAEGIGVVQALEAQRVELFLARGQQRDVLVYRFVTEGTFEERINEMLTEKRRITDLAVSSGENWVGDMSTSELRALFSLS